MKAITAAVAGIFILVSSAPAIEPPSVSFRLHGLITGAQFFWGSVPEGRDLKAFLPAVGLSYASVSYKYKSIDTWYGYTDKSSGQTTVRLIMPKVGGRWYGRPVGDLRHFGIIEGFLVIPLVSGKSDGKKMTKDEKEDIRDVLTTVGLTLGYGVEYYFSSQFSLGGEVCMNWAYWDYDSDDNGWSYESSLILGATLARATFNFYFK